jgi:hypothetical protein
MARFYSPRATVQPESARLPVPARPGTSGLSEEPQALTLRQGQWLDWTAETGF